LDQEQGAVLTIAGNRRHLLRRAIAGAITIAAAPLLGCAAQAQTHNLRVSRDAGCGCCHTWMARMIQSGRFSATMTDVADMAALKQRLGVPTELASCHTATIEHFVIEGHVPAADILRLIAERPAGVAGLAVPGMPTGSPGMEAPDGRRDGFEVLAFDLAGQWRVFSRYS
jgi:hypothetical protein